jgi:rhodanese-related sulfurtransferase
MSRLIDGRGFGIALLIFLASSVIGLVYNSVYPKGIPLIRQKVKEGDTLATGPIDQGADTGAVSTVLGLTETYRLYESGEAVFLDARPRADYEEERIMGAISLPEFEFDDAYPVASQFLSSDTHIVVYCQGRDCDEAMIVQERLVEMGYTRVDVFLGGMPEWLDADYPTDSGPMPGEMDEGDS